MPRKRTTRAMVTSKLKLPDVKVCEEMSENDRQRQLLLYIAEFKSNVKAIKKNHEKRQRARILAITRRTEAQITQIPTELRHLTIREFAALGGTFEEALKHIRNQKGDSVSQTLQRIDNLTCIDVPISKTTILEEPGDGKNTVVTEFRTVKSKRTARPKSTLCIKRAVQRAFVAYLALYVKAVRTAFLMDRAEILGDSGENRGFMKTPAITPKFNPNLPVTPENIRNQRPGERLMSMAGTPVRQAFQDDLKILEGNLVSAGLKFSPRTMKRLVATVSSTVSALSK